MTAEAAPPPRVKANRRPVTQAKSIARPEIFLADTFATREPAYRLSGI